MKTGDLKLLGLHNFENVMAAVAMAYCAGVDMDSIRKSVCEFTAVEHRIEYVTEKNGVAYYNDSKGTNPDAAIKGIQAMNRPTLLIGGGYDKESSYDEWIQAFDVQTRQMPETQFCYLLPAQAGDSLTTMSREARCSRSS